MSSRSQAIATIPEEDLEETLAEHREQQKAVTAKTMEKLGRQARRTFRGWRQARRISAGLTSRVATPARVSDMAAEPDGGLLAQTAYQGAEGHPVGGGGSVRRSPQTEAARSHSVGTISRLRP